MTIGLSLRQSIAALGAGGISVLAFSPCPPAFAEPPSRPGGSLPPIVADVKTPPGLFAEQPVDTERAAALACQPGDASPPAVAAVSESQFTPPPGSAQVCYDEPGDGSVWAMGETYKCRFAANGFTYIPMFGSSAPRNYPVRFVLQHIDAGGDALPLDAGQPVRVGNRVTIDRGFVQEVYLLTPRSIEQEFILAQRPGQGAVTIRVAIETDLAGADGGDALRFSNDLGAVNYSKAVVVDSAARRFDIATGLVVAGGAIEMTVPASVLAGAAYPLTVDPVLSTTTIAGTTTDDQSPDVAYDATNDGYLIVWEHVVSATDGDVISERYDHNGVAIAGSVAAIDITTANWRRPRVGNNNIGNSYLIAAEVGAAGARQVFGRVRAASSNALSPTFQISDPAFTGDQFNADVGGDPFSGQPPSYFCVVWERAVSAADHDILARLVDQATSAVSGGVIPIDNSVGTHDSNPNIAKSNGTAALWTVVWQRTASATNEDIYAAQVNYLGTIFIPTFVIDTTAVDNRHPAVSTLGTFGNYMVVYEEDPTGAADIHARVYNGNVLMGGGNLTTLEGIASTAARTLPAVDANADRFVVACSQQVGVNDFDAYISTYCYTGALRIAEPHRILDITAASSDSVQLASIYGGGGTVAPSEFMAVWADHTTPSAGGSLRAARYQAKATCCRADINQSGFVNVDDLLIVITGWGDCNTCPADVNGDSHVNVDDLLAVITGWGPCL